MAPIALSKEPVASRSSLSVLALWLLGAVRVVVIVVLAVGSGAVVVEDVEAVKELDGYGFGEFVMLVMVGGGLGALLLGPDCESSGWSGRRGGSAAHCIVRAFEDWGCADDAVSETPRPSCRTGTGAAVGTACAWPAWTCFRGISFSDDNVFGSLASRLSPSGSSSKDISSSTLTPLSLQTSHHSRITSSFVLPPHPSHFQLLLSRASFSRISALASIPPTWPALPFSAMKLRSAVSAVRTPHAGIHVSSWKPEMLRQISRLTSNRPEGVRKRKFGGLRGYVVGSVMRP